MENIIKRFEIIAFIAVIGLSFAACDNGPDKGVAPTITTATLPDGVAGTAYSQTLEAKGDKPVTWSIGSGTLPEGLSLLATGTITGTPTEANTYTFTVKAANSAGSGTKQLSITITGGGNQGTAPTITTATLPNGVAGTAYSQTLTATGNRPVTWSVEGGALPAGLNLSETTGAITGTPTTAGKSAFTVKAANSVGSGTKELSITITSGNPTIPVPMEMVQIQGGTFTMGSPGDEPSRLSGEGPQHQVTLTQNFYMCKYPVTQTQYEAVMGTNPSIFTIPVSPETSTANRPVERVSWYDVLVFCNKLSMSEGLSPAYRISGSTNPAGWGDVPEDVNETWNAVEIVAGSNGYRLPTEAQWEYACRAGTTGPFSTGDNITTNQANYDGNNPYNNNAKGEFRERTTEVDKFAPNVWGLYDMHGNLFEWCWDRYGTYTDEAQTNPTGAGSGDYRVVHGGSWINYGHFLRSAFRFGIDPYSRSDIIGFRLVRPAQTGGGNQTSIEMVPIQGGPFRMGSPGDEPERDSDETQHQVTLTGFSMGKYPVTQAQYQAVMGSNPSGFKTPVSPETSTANRPVERVNWYDALVFCNKLSMSENLSPAYSIKGSTDPADWGTNPADIWGGDPAWDAVVIEEGSTGYRLPTEAQWEYACRAGTETPFNTGDNITTAQANYDGNYPYNDNPKGTFRERTTEVGNFAPNAWDLYDMHGNVFEWCWDLYGDYESGTQTDPTGAVSGYYRVDRGGSWFHIGLVSRSAFRGHMGPHGKDDSIGFRLVLPNS